MSTLEALARAGADRRRAPVGWPVIDARRGEAFAAAWTAARTSLAPAALAPEALAERSVQCRRTAGRRATGRYASGSSSKRAGAPSRPTSTRVHRLSAAARLPARRGGEPADRDALLPDYLREPDAVPPSRVTAPPAASIEVRRLTYADLPQVVAIERRAFPTPWSLAMFVLELSKPSGICLGAAVEGELVGYLICSRYDTVWHVMNVAVDPDRRRRGIATRAAGRAARARRRPGRAAHARGAAAPTAARSGSTSASASARAGVRRRYYQDNGEDALIMWRTPATLRGGRSTTCPRVA